MNLLSIYNTSSWYYVEQDSINQRAHNPYCGYSTQSQPPQPPKNYLCALESRTKPLLPPVITKELVRKALIPKTTPQDLQGRGMGGIQKKEYFSYF